MGARNRNGWLASGVNGLVSLRGAAVGNAGSRDVTKGMCSQGVVKA